MKKIIFILFAMLILSCCSNISNDGYGYGISSSQKINKSSECDIFDKIIKKDNKITMYLYDS